MRLAESGLKELQEYVDTLIIIPNQNLFRIANERTTFADAFKMADDVLHSGVRGVTDLMVKPGLINLDFADIRTVMREMGKAMMGTGEATGDRRAIEAAEAAISNPLLDDVSLRGARALLINITGGNDMTLFEVDEAANRVREEVDSDANIIFGSTFSENMEGKMRVSVVATGIDAQTLQNATSGTGGQKFTPSPEPKKPFAFATAASVKSEYTKPIPRPSQEPARENASVQASATVRPHIEQRAGGAVRVEKVPEPQQTQVMATGEVAVQRYRVSDFEQDENEVRILPEVRHEIRGQMVDTAQQVSVGGRQAQREPVREPSKNFFQRMADVGRSLSSRGEESSVKPHMHERVHVVQKTVSAETAEKPKKLVDEDQYLDIPAFLRRQAN